MTRMNDKSRCEGASAVDCFQRVPRVVDCSSLASSHAPAARRSFILLAVLVVMVSAILVATSLLFVAQTEAAGAAGAGDAAQARALLWSGAQAIMAELHAQKGKILAGEMPALEPQYVIYETSTRAGVVRLLPVARGGAVISAEAGKLDLNVIDAASLARTGMVDAAVAESIASWRSRLGRPIQSVTELMEVPGVSVDTLFGSSDALFATVRAFTSMNEGSGSSGIDELLAAPARGLADVVTAFSVEPAVQRSGKLRINLNVQWSDELGRRVEERFCADAAVVLKQIFDSGARFENESALFATMRQYQTPIEQWPEIIDTFTTDSGDLHFGRLDINTAPREVLRALPGVTAEQADQIMSVREELSPDQRATIAWPAVRQILKPEQYELLAGQITTRCWTYRVRIAAGEVDADDPTGPISNPQIQELVIDLCGPKPRLAYLRDITLLQDTVLMAREASRSGVATANESLHQQPSDEGEPVTTAPASTRPSRAASLGRRPSPPASRAARPSGDDDAENADAASPADAVSEQPQGRARIGRWTAGSLRDPG